MEKAENVYRVTVMTDMHLMPGDYEDGFESVDKLVGASRPDFVVFNGDNFFGFNGEDLAFYDRLDAYFREKGIKWTAILGNHDGEYNSADRRSIAEHIANLPGTVFELNPIGKRYGNFFYDTPVAGTALAFLDSGGKATLSERIRSGFSSKYAALTKEQIAFYLNEAHGKRAVFLFIHIPLNEFENGYYLALANCKVIYGAVRENITPEGKLNRFGDIVCSPAVNTGFFDAAAKEGNLKAVFAGHDHLNDFAVDYRGVRLVQVQRSFSSKLASYGFKKRGFTDFSGATVLDVTENGFDVKQLFLKDLSKDL